MKHNSNRLNEYSLNSINKVIIIGINKINFKSDSINILFSDI